MIDLTELAALNAALAATGPAIEAGGAAVVARGALNIKNDWRNRARVTAGAHARLYPNSVSYDVAAGPGLVEAEIGPDKGRPQGALGNLLEFGSAHNPPHNDGGQALAAEEPRFIAAVEALAEQVGRL